MFRKSVDYLSTLFTPDYAAALEFYFGKKDEQLDNDLNIGRNVLIARALKNVSNDSMKYDLE